MNTYNQANPLDQGATKISEIALDSVQPLIGTPEGGNMLDATQQMISILKDLLRRQNYILRSNGEMIWDGSQILFNYGSVGNDAVLEILQTEATSQRKWSLTLTGTAGANSTGGFNSIALADGELLYLELDPANFIDNSGSPVSSFALENAVGGGSIVSGRTVKKIALGSTSGIPEMTNPSGGTSTTFYIPLALRKGTDLLWIPHGINWPSGIASKLGAVIVSGLQAYPEFFAASQAELLTIFTALSSVGGVVLVTAPITIDQTVNVPADVKVLGRGMGKNALTVVPGGQIRLGSRSTLSGLPITASATFTGTMVSTNSGNASRIEGCQLDISAATNVATNVCIDITGDNHRIKDCLFKGVVGTNRKPIQYTSGTGSTFLDCNFDSATSLKSAYTFVVGTSATVASSLVTHTTIQAAVSAAIVGDRILVLNGTYTENVSIGNGITLEGQGRETILNGNLTFTLGSQLSLVKAINISGNLTFNASSARNIVSECWQNSIGSITDGGTDNLWTLITG